MKFASIIPASLLALLFLGGFASPSVGKESRWASPEEETVKFIIAAETKTAHEVLVGVIAHRREVYRK
jgi:hypothetical protein